jgi:hypothetical protein
VTVSFSVVVAVTVMVKSWLGLIGVTISGELDVDEGGSDSGVEEEGANALLVGAPGMVSVVEDIAGDDVVSWAGCRVG